MLMVLGLGAAASTGCDNHDAGCAAENGAATCNRFVTAYCNRVIQCCTAAGPSACPAYGYDAAMCRAEIVTEGTDCSSTEWTDVMYCVTGAMQCANDVPLIACSDVTGGTANLPHSCMGIPRP